MVEVIRKYWNQIQDIIVDWYQVLEPMYKAQERTLVESA